MNATRNGVYFEADAEKREGREERDGVLMSKFFNRGGSIFYCLSALSIIWGLSEIITPIFRECELLGEKVLCIGALNLYEIVVIGVLLVLILWKEVKDDAISLVILSALFFIVGGIMIGAIANDAVFLAAIIGIASLLLAGGKVFSIRKYAAVYMGPFLLTGISVILGWNYLISPFMAGIHSGDSGIGAEHIWRYGWIVMLGSALFMFIEAFLSKRSRERESSSAFINSPAMGWIFTGEVLIGCSVHQYVLSYIFDIPFMSGDFLPLIIIVLFLLLELKRFYGKTGTGDSVIAMLPFFTIIVMLAASAIPKITGASMLLWSPGVLFVLSGAWLVVLGIKKNRPAFFYCAAPYLIAFLVVGLGTSENSIAVANLHWKLPLALLTGAITTLGIIFRKPFLLFICSIIAPIALLSISEVDLFLAENYCSQTGVAGIMTGGSILVIYHYFRDETPLYVGIIGALFLSVGIITFAGELLSLRMVFCAIVVIGLATLIWLKTKNRVLAIIVALPLLRFLYLNLTHLHGWHLIFLSFLLLIAGGLISIRKGGGEFRI